ncbi:MAG: hypothetical protein DRR08_21135 [Candidatus Parabeggiatoa sp. nov. 2]|nr:MAG: hypothetical protein DRR08_21135 [Gammaproteobacteria bacterium]
MKSSFSLEIKDSRSVSHRKRNFLLFLLILSSAAVAIYFFAPKMITSTPKTEAPEPEQLAVKEQIIKIIPIQNIINLKTTPSHAQSQQ